MVSPKIGSAASIRANKARLDQVRRPSSTMEQSEGVTPFPPERFQVAESVNAGHHRLVLSGELDVAGGPQLEGELMRLPAEETTGIVLDLSKTTFIDSTGLRAVLFAKEMSDDNGYDFTIISGPPQVQRLFDLTGLCDVLPFEGESASPSLDGEPVRSARLADRRAERPTPEAAPTGSRRPGLPLGAAILPTGASQGADDGGPPM